jgi:type VI protein secretion system component Hcp
MSTSGAGGADDPSESVTLNYSSARVTFKSQDPKGGPGAAVEADIPGTCQ